MRGCVSLAGFRRLCVVLLFLLPPCWTAGVVRAAAPPPRVAAALAERDRWEREARQMHGHGKLAEAVAAAEKMLALEREWLGKDHLDAARSLELLAELHEERQDFGGAVRALQEATAVRAVRQGEQHWRTIDVRLKAAHVQRLGKLGPQTRQRLQEAQRLHARAVALGGQGKYREAARARARGARRMGRLARRGRPGLHQ